MKPGASVLAYLCPPRAVLYNRAALTFKTLHFLKWPKPCRDPQHAWAAGSFALHPDLHKKGHKAVGGRGTSAFFGFLRITKCWLAGFVP